MKRIFLLSLALTFIFSTGFFSVAKSTSAQISNLSQFIELLITIGVIPSEKAVAARALSGVAIPVPVPVSTPVLATSTSYIQVLEPNGGESWEIDLDLPYSIKWGSSGLTEARVALIDAKNVVCDLSPQPVASKDGNREFKILLKTAQCLNTAKATTTPLKSGSYKARVYYTFGTTTIRDDSDATFKILPVPVPSIKVTYPNGGESLERNEEYDVKYTIKDFDEVMDDLIYLYLLDHNGNVAFNSHKVLNNARTYTLDLPNSLRSGAYKVKLKTTAKEGRVDVEDVSDNFFWISSGL